MKNENDWFSVCDIMYPIQYYEMVLKENMGVIFDGELP